MEDDHVDRPGVEVRQRMELTGTNSSIGLIVLIINAHQLFGGRKNRPHLLRKMRFAGLVALGGAIRPDPIPNSAVKLLSANGTMAQALGE